MKMKKMKLFALMFLAGTLIFSSCNKDDEDVAVAGPSLTFQNGANTLEFDGSKGIDVRLDFTAEGEVSTFKLVFSLNNATADSIYDLTSTFKGEKSGNYSFTRSAALVGADLNLDATGTVKYVFTLTDKENNTKTATYTVNAASTAPEISAFSARVLGASGSNSGSYLNATEGYVYTQGDATANDTKIDLVYKWVTDAGLYSPNHADVSTVLTNSTVIGIYAGTTAFDNIDKEEIATLAVPTGNDAKTLAVGNILVFKTADAKMGVLKVTALNNGTSGDMTVDIKVQQ